MKYRNIDTPCIGICSTIYGDEICRGCKRASQEVIEWNTYQPEQKAEILARLDTITSQITAERLEVVDAELLKLKLKRYNIKFREEFSVYSWAYNLLRAGADHIQDILQYGIVIKPAFAHLRLRQLIDEIDDAIYALSEAQLKQD
jgi:predicted Fe-S protein YdhL (DUF1289 family)